MTQGEAGVPIPSAQDLKKLSQQELLEKLAQANFSIQEANRIAERRVAEEKARSKQEMDRLRAATSQHTRDLENQNRVLLQSLSRLQSDLDKYQEEVVTLRVRLGNGYKSDEQSRPGMSEPVTPGSTVQIAHPSPTLSGDAIPAPNKP